MYSKKRRYRWREHNTQPISLQVEYNRLQIERIQDSLSEFYKTQADISANLQKINDNYKAIKFFVIGAIAIVLSQEFGLLKLIKEFIAG